MTAKLKSGMEYESAPEVAEYDNAAESSLVLHAVKEAVGRMNYACRVVVHTECSYVAAAIENHWPETWRENAWKNSKGKDIKDAVLWDMILQEMEVSGHEMESVQGKHGWSEWMRWKLPLTKPLKDMFQKIKKDLQN